MAQQRDPRRQGQLRQRVVAVIAIVLALGLAVTGLMAGLGGCALSERPEADRPPAQHSPVPQSGSDVVPPAPATPTPDPVDPADPANPADPADPNSGDGGQSVI